MEIKREDKKSNNIQIFGGGFDPIDPRIQTMIGGSCEAPVIDMDRLAARIRPENGLKHTFPTGNRDIYVSDVHTKRHTQMVEHFNHAGIGSSASIFVLPTYSILKGIGIRVSAMPEGFEFKVMLRNNAADDAKTLIPNVKYVNTTTGFGCDIKRQTEMSSDLGEIIIKPLDKGLTSRTEVMLYETHGGLFMPDANEVMIVLTKQPTVPGSEAGGKEEPINLIAKDLEIELVVSYDTIIKALI